jgi:autonomous glycyl radical cofactor GrcA
LELLENEFNALKSEYEELKSQYSALVEFKNQIDNEKKDEMINRFYMLSDEDKADVIANKEKYSLDEIEAKLSVICVRKKVNFDLESNDKNDNTLEGMTTFNVNSLNVDNSAPEWVEAMRAVKQKEQWS